MLLMENADYVVLEQSKIPSSDQENRELLAKWTASPALSLDCKQASKFIVGGE
jgi:hypothetical protein